MNNTTDKDRALAYALRESVAQGLMDKAVQLIAQHREEAVRESEDKKRLDWLLDFINEDIMPTNNGLWICTDGNNSHQATDPRAAIDAAMKGTT